MKRGHFNPFVRGGAMAARLEHNGPSITRRKLVREAQRAARSAGRPYMLCYATRSAENSSVKPQILFSADFFP